MKRNILTIVGCAALSGLLLFLFLFAIFTLTGLGWFFRDPAVHRGDYETIEKRYGDPFEMFSRAIILEDFVALPLVALAVGMFAGRFSHSRAGWIAFVGLLPFEVRFFWVFGFDPLEIALGLGYLALACVASIATFRIRRRRMALGS
ncbi:MAG: hypothetical protein L0212_13140 [Acidobacteria bacterium]|nr:hypothetical protein [Acidobacteriota bacterium]